MSYIDNELNAAERAAVEAFVLTDSKYAAALAVFEKTKLHASTNEYMEMEDKIFLYRFPEMQASLDTDFKKSLYRKEAPIRKIVFTPNILRASLAIAALLILFIGIQLFKTNTVIKDKTALAITNNSSTNPKQTENVILRSNELDVSVNKINNSSALVSQMPLNKKLNNTNNNLGKSATGKQAVFEDQTIASNNTSTSIVATTEGLNQDSRENESQKNESQIRLSLMETMPNEEEKAVLVIPSTYKEIDTEKDDRTINIGMLEIDGSAFRGITRRFSALLKRNKIEKEK
ncbi:MAG: hypothetical protein ACEQR6_05000 [Burkholderiaceae bacterium]